MECKKSENAKNCSCSYEPCPRKGLCCECVTYHRENNELPGCFFGPEDERAYNRSIDFFVKTYKGKNNE